MDRKPMEVQDTFYEEEPQQLFVDLNPFDFVEGDEHLTVDLSSQHFKESLSKKYEWMEYDANKNYVFCRYCKHSTYGQKIAILSHRLACVRLDFLHNHAISAMHARSRKEALKKLRDSLMGFSSDKKKEESGFSYHNSHPAFNLNIEQFSKKRVHRRNYQPHWEITFPWLKFDTENHYMICKHCRGNPQYADITSSFYLGSRVFRLDVIRKHSESQAHRRCTNAVEGLTKYTNTIDYPMVKKEISQYPIIKKEISEYHIVKKESLEYTTIKEKAEYGATKETLEYPIIKEETSKYPTIKKQLEFSKNIGSLHTPLKSPSRVRQRNKHYLNHWEHQFPWLQYKVSENLMFCKFCLQFPNMCKETPFINGSNSFRIDSLRKHEVSRAHVQAIFARDSPSDVCAMIDS